MSLKSEPERWCAWDRCHPFVPATANHVYCTECNCKRKAENARKRLTDPALGDELLWTLQENRKIGRMDTAQAKNKWLLDNSKIVFFDIETFDLAADFGLVMVGCIKERGGETRTFIAHGDADEKECIVGIRDVLENASYLCTYYGTGFDIPYINTRLLINNERPINQLRHIDLYYTVRNKLKLNRNRLANVELAFLVDLEDALKGKIEKTAITPGVWRRALQGDQRCLDYIVDHCQKDVIILEKAFDKLRGFINLSATRWRRFGGSY